MPQTNPTTGESKYGWVISLLFWLFLLAAAAMYGLVVLSPKMLAYLELERDYRENQIQLVRLENQVEYFHKVADALRTDPEFAEELARVDFDAARPDEERIAVDRRLNLRSEPLSAPLPQPEATLPWYVPTLKLFVGDPQFRTLTLGIAAALVILAFTLLFDSLPLSLHTDNREARPHRLRDRYRKQ